MQEPKQDLVTAPAAPPLIGDAGATSYPSFGEQRSSILSLSNRKTSADWSTK